MATDLQTRPSDSGSDAHNPEQKHYDKVFNDLTSKEHLAKDGQSGDRGGGKESELFSGGTATAASASGATSAASGSTNEGSNIFKRLGGRVKGMSARKKASYAALGTGLIGALIAGFIGLFGFLNIFKLDHLLSNIERIGFSRLQVDMEGRSSKWLQAYLTLRLGEIDNPDVTPDKRENIYFRANRVDNNNPLTDWYKTLRASKFEQEVFGKEGIKFTSMAHQSGGRTIFRPAVIFFNDEKVTFELTDAEKALLASDNPDINQFNGRLSQFIDAEVLDSDKAGRKRIKEVVNRNTKWYQVVKRFYLRKSIQNMTGIRSWRFFEKTRAEWHEKKVEIRNKIVTKAFPESMKGGKFVQCVFGIVSCSSNTDTNNPNNRATIPTLGGVLCTAGSTDPACDTGVDGDGNPDTNDNITNGGEAGTGVGEGVSGDGANDMTKSLISKVAGKLISGGNILGTVDTLASIDENMKNGSLSTMVYNARLVQAISWSSLYSIARDQMRTGELSSEEAAAFMETVSHAGSGEGWNTIISDSNRNLASAATLEPARSKTEYCEGKYQTALLAPENKQVAENQYHYLCDSQKIGSATNAATIEGWWNNSVGFILGPLLDAYNSAGIFGAIFDAINGVIDSILQPLISGILKSLGLADNVEALMSWLVVKVAAILGAGPALPTNATSGMISNQLLQGKAAEAETMTRFLGGSLTTQQARERTEQSVLAFREAERENASVFTKYLSLSSPNSVLAKGLFAATTSEPNQLISSSMKSLGNLPNILFGSRAKAAPSAYAAANFAGIETYDFPSACLDQSPLTMTPVSATNADDLGIINPAELTWELLEDSDAFYARLYELQENSDLIKEVYDCIALDSALRGSIGGRYATELLGPNAIQKQVQGTIPSGQEVSAEGWSWPLSNADYVPLSNCYEKPGHTGIDIPVPSGTNVLAARAGTIVDSDSSGATDAGKYIIIKHGPNTFSNYQHNDTLLKTSGTVMAGDVIARSGNTGFSTGPHIHFSITTQQGLDSRSVVAYSENPLNFLPSIAGRNLGGCR